MQRLVVTVFAGIALALSTCGAAMTSASSKPFGTFNGCPAGLLPLPPDLAGYSPTARRVALNFLGSTYEQMNRSHHWGLKLSGARVGQVLLARHWLPNRWITQECGGKVLRRTLVVEIRLPAMENPSPRGPCNDCAGITLLLGKTTRGWVTWGQY